MIRLVLPHGMIRTLIIVCVSTALTFVALDVLIDRGDFLRHFQQSWVSHFTPAVSFDYGSPIDHRFPPSLLLKNWDMTIPAALGIVLLLRQVRKVPLAIVPVAWLALVLTVFATHTPWWPYYYVHIAIPLCWCAGSGIAIMLAASPQNIGVVLGRDREVNSRRRFGALAVLAVFLVCALSWMVLRVYLQISGIRNSPQTYYSLVLKEIQRFKPFTQWIYADNLTYSFHAGIPMPPQLAVVSLKRLWSGELTIAGVGDEVRKFKPGLIVLRNDTRELPFQDLLDTEYRLVYRDAENRLYAHRTIANKPDL